MRVWLIVALTLITVIGVRGAYSATVGPPQALRWSGEVKQNLQEMNSRDVCDVGLCRHHAAAAAKNHGSVVFYRRLLGHLGESRLGSQRAAPAMRGSTNLILRAGPLEVFSDNDRNSEGCDVAHSRCILEDRLAMWGTLLSRVRLRARPGRQNKPSVPIPSSLRRLDPFPRREPGAKEASFATAFS